MSSIDLAAEAATLEAALAALPVAHIDEPGSTPGGGAETADAELVPTGIETRHFGWHDDRGIALDWAVAEVNARTIHGQDDAPVGIEYFFRNGGGIGWDWSSYKEDGDGWSQGRPDKPDEDDSGRLRKYVGNNGKKYTGKRLLLTKTMAARARRGAYEKVAIVEGTGQTMVMSWLFRDQDAVLVVGVPGCWGWSDEATFDKDLREIVKKATGNITIFFDKDVTGNPLVWAAGWRLIEYIARATDGTFPRFAKVTGGEAKDGWDDHIAREYRNPDGTIDEESARHDLTNILGTKSLTFLLSKTRPKGKALVATGKPRTATIKRDECAITLPNPYQGGVETLTNFAPHIAKSYIAASRLDPKAEVQLLFDLAIETDEGTKHVKGWPAKRLREIDAWLEQARYSKGVWVNSDGMAAQIVAAMKADWAERGGTDVDLYYDTGWGTTADGDAVHHDSVGGITATGHSSDHGWAVPEDPNGENYDLSIIADTTDEQQRDALAKTLLAAEWYADPTWWMAASGTVFGAGAGAKPEGFVYMEGIRGIGKSQRQVGLASMMGPAYTITPLQGLGYRAGADMALGLHNVTAIPDDFTIPENDPDVLKVELAILDFLLRRGGAGEGEDVVRVNKTKRADGNWGQGKGNKAWTAFCASGEKVPPMLRGSSLERMFSVHVDRRGWTVNGVDNFGAWKKATADGTLRLGYATYLRWVAGQINNEGGLQAWLGVLREKRDTAADMLRTNSDGAIMTTNDRVHLVAGGRLMGWLLALDAAKDLGALTVEQATRLREAAVKRIGTAMVEHYRRYIAEVEERFTPEVLLDLLGQAIASGRWTLEESGTLGPRTDAKTERLGMIQHAKEGRFVALLAKQVALAVGKTHKEVLAPLRALSYDDGTFQIRHSLDLGGKAVGGTTGFYRIPEAVWGGGAITKAKQCTCQQEAEETVPGDFDTFDYPTYDEPTPVHAGGWSLATDGEF